MLVAPARARVVLAAVTETMIRKNSRACELYCDQPGLAGESGFSYAVAKAMKEKYGSTDFLQYEKGGAGTAQRRVLLRHHGDAGHRQAVPLQRRRDERRLYHQPATQQLGVEAALTGDPELVANRCRTGLPAGHGAGRGAPEHVGGALATGRLGVRPRLAAYRRGAGRIDAFLCLTDLGSQDRLLLGPEARRAFILPALRRLADAVHREGVKLLFHSCGSIREVVPELILEQKLVREGWLSKAEASGLGALRREATFERSPWVKWTADEVRRRPRGEVAADEPARCPEPGVRAVRDGPRWPSSPGSSILESGVNKVKKPVRLGRLLPVLVLAGAVLAGCASISTTPTPVSAAAPVTIEVTNYKFAPNNLQVQGIGSFTLQVHNGTGTVHNFTVKNPQGNVIQSVDLPAGQTTAVTVDLAAVGTYNFYCNKPFHSTLGMTGQIVVGGPAAGGQGAGASGTSSSGTGY